MTNHRKDASEPGIRSALEEAGFQVWDILPCDLLTWRIDKGWKPLECKSPYLKGETKYRLDKRQIKQIEFLQITGCPLAFSPEQALKVLGAL